MAYIELSSNVLGSSLDNFLVFQNNGSSRPTVSFYVNGGSNPSGTITIKDALDDDGYNKVITYSPTDIISDSSFSVNVASKTATTFAFLECLKKNQIFFDFTLKEIENVGIIILASIDTSTRYSIVSDNNYIVISGTYSSYTPKEPNKFVLLENTTDGQITLEKYSYGDTVSFNVTAPFEHLTFKDPFVVGLYAYRIENNSAYTESIANGQITVFPTTLPKFSDVKLDGYNYMYDGQVVNFLTNRFVRDYNYGEVVGLSLMTNVIGIGLTKVYYTVSGRYLGEDASHLEYFDNLPNRIDFYFIPDIERIETDTNAQVGYVEVFATYNGEEITNRVRYNVVPRCNKNNEIFFVNELGGIDSFNFLGERIYESSIDDQTTYFKNPTGRWGKTKEIEIVGQKKNKVEHTLTTTIIDEQTAKWLNEMAKSKYAYLFVNSYPTKFQKIIITDFDIKLSDRDNTFEVEMTYQDSDANISL